MKLEMIADKVATWYAVRSWWAELEDLKQEAWVAVLEARNTYKPERGEEAVYLRCAAQYRVRDYVWAQSSPVTGRKHHGECLRGLQRVPVDEVYNYKACDSMENVQSERWLAELTQAVRQLVRNGRDGDIAARVLLDREKPAAIAESLGCSIHRVWGASSRARGRIKKDMDLRYAMAHNEQIA